MKNFKKKLLLICLPFLLTITACKEDTLQDKISRIGVNYFSVNQYIYDQWKNFDGHPFSILKTEKIGDKIDSSYSNSEKLNWVELFTIFFETDISDKEMLGHYKFSTFEDKEDQTVNFYYQAIDDYLFTKKLLISADPFTNHIKAIYIETFSHSMIFGDVNQKLFYAPFKTIQIQKYESPLVGSKKSKVTQYYLMH